MSLKLASFGLPDLRLLRRPAAALPDSTSYGVPISYRLDGKQYVMAPAGSKLIAYVLK
jgi:hypothetical protein